MTITLRLPTLAVLSLLVLLIAACVPSVNPFYTAQDVVTDPGLVGSWHDAKGGDQPDTWTFSPSGDQRFPDYNLTVTEENGKRSGKFKAVLFKLGSVRFLDLVATQLDLADTQANLSKSTLIPGHILLRVYQIGPELRLAITNPDWCDKYLEAHPDSVAHRKDPDADGLCLTATTAELQKFVLAHLGDDELFAKESDAADMVRPAAPTGAEHSTSNTQH